MNRTPHVAIFLSISFLISILCLHQLPVRGAPPRDDSPEQTEKGVVVSMTPDTLWFQVPVINQSQTLSFTVHGESGYMHFTVMRENYDNEFSHTPGGMTTNPGSEDEVFITYTPTDYGNDTEVYFLNPDFGDPPNDEVVCMAIGPEPILHVCPNGTGDYTTIQAAINAAANGMEIILCDHVYTGAGNRAIDFLGKQIIVRSESGDPTACVIDCQNSANGLNFLSGQYSSAEFSGIGIQNANPYGMHFWQTHLMTIENCRITGSAGTGINAISDCTIIFIDCDITSNAGGGVFTPAGSYSFTGCNFISNTTPGSGGGMLLEGSSTASIESCTFDGNIATGNGGGLAYYPGRDASAGSRNDVVINNCEFLENYGSSGGAVYAEWGAVLDISNSVFRDNECLDGVMHCGGLEAVGFSRLNISNSVVSGNLSNGIQLYDHSDLFLSGSAVVGNWYDGIQTRGMDSLAVECVVQTDACTIALNGQHGLDLQAPVFPSQMENTIIALNGWQSIHHILSLTQDISCCDIFGNPGGDWYGDLGSYQGANGNFSADPWFCDWGTGDFTLAADSPCLPGNHPGGDPCGLIGALGQGTCGPAGGLFTEVTTPLLGVSPNALTYGAAWADYDQDGLVDLFITSSENGTGEILSRLLRNTNGTAAGFSDVTTSCGTLVSSVSRAPKWADFDNDGDLDLLVTSISGANHLFRSSGSPDWVFTDVAVVSGIGFPDDSSRDAAWSDVDRDGDLDLYICVSGTNRLLENLGPPLWNFVDVATAAGVADGGQGRSCAFADYDNDSYPDLYITNQDVAHPNRLYHNNGDGTFSDATAGLLGDTSQGNGIAWGDYDGDGDLDLFLANFDANNRLFRNDGRGFTEVAQQAGVAVTDGYSRGAAWCDVDNDGDLDLYVSDYDANQCYLNDAGVFTNAAPGTPAGDSRSGRGVAFADYDNNGFADLYVGNHNAEAMLLQNTQTNENHWLQIQLIGGEGQAGAIGARVHLFADGQTDSQEMIREVSGGSGYFSQGDLRVSFGLGGMRAVDMLQVRWPDGGVQTWYDLEVDQALLLEKDAAVPVPELQAASPLKLHSAVPNPFNSLTRIGFDLPQSGPAWLTIYDLKGRLVRRLVAGEIRSAGSNLVDWTGVDESGRGVTTGVYLVRLQFGNEDRTQSLVLIK